MNARLERDALVRLRAASLDLIAAGRHTDAGDVMAIVERIDPSAGRPTRVPAGPAASSDAALVARTSGPTSDVPPHPASATYKRQAPGAYMPCANCGHTMVEHCTTHLLPCCPGSLMHGGDEGTWTP